MLSKKYNVCSSPASYNTPMGFCRTILQELPAEGSAGRGGSTPAVIIQEMGARKRGDIKEMCRLFRPQHGILTSIGSAHLETFKTLENIRAEKMELLNAIPDGGVKINGAEIDVSRIKPYKTNLLGKHNQLNIEICARMALALGVEKADIDEAVAELKATPHRLELIESNGVKIIDDSYNSSPHGCVAALEVVNELKTAHAVVCTCGMVELGKSQYEENYKFGKNIASVAESAIIVAETNKAALAKGLLDGGFNEANIYYVKDIDEAKPLFSKLLREGDILLIENDLPDNYK
jgi:UDP-N-acetylmuramoyl-tripeptide--D-alanyl-D-alanine ligase